MKLMSFDAGRAGILLGDAIVDLHAAARALPAFAHVPGSIQQLLDAGLLDNEVLNRLVEDGWKDIDGHRGTSAEAVLKPIASVRPGPPLKPPLILAVGMNYSDHLEEMGSPKPDRPYSFVKASSSVVGPGADIILPEDESEMVDWEAELAVVIGRPCYRVSAADALDFVAGYTCSNDISARDWVDRVNATPGVMEPINNWASNMLGKQFPTFCPLGPVIVTTDEIADVGNLDIMCRVNGKIVQKSNTCHMVFSVAELISYLSHFYLLEPGVVIMTGTMGGVGIGRDPRVFLRPGDRVEVEIEGIGILVNSVCGRS